MVKKTKEKRRDRTERRFLPRSTTPPLLVMITGAIGAAAMGAGLMGQYGRPEPVPYAVWILAAGALLSGLAVWIGTSGEPVIRVGDAGVGVEKGGIRRVAWWAVEAITWDGERQELVVSGKDEGGAALVTRVGVKAQPQAVAWIVKEARARVPNALNVSDEALDALPKARKDEAPVVKLEPMQVVGMRCAASDRVIAYEPDARVCPRCERVYHKASVPDACACGASLEAQQKKPAEAGAA